MYLLQLLLLKCNILWCWKLVKFMNKIKHCAAKLLICYLTIFDYCGITRKMSSIKYRGQTDHVTTPTCAAFHRCPRPCNATCLWPKCWPCSSIPCELWSWPTHIAKEAEGQLVQKIEWKQTGLTSLPSGLMWSVIILTPQSYVIIYYTCIVIMKRCYDKMDKMLCIYLD